jgi:predicted acyltransferase
MTDTQSLNLPETNGSSSTSTEAVVETPGTNTGEAGVTTGRLASLDTLRGFNMFWIMGGAELFAAISKYLNFAWLNPINDNLTEHVKWEGFHYHDMIFPLFLFIMGVTFPFSLARRLTGSNKGAMARRVIFRAGILVLLGLVYYGLFQLKGFDQQRMMGVLQRLGIAWGIASLIALFTNIRGQVVALITLLVGYWLAMRFMHVPGFPVGTLTPEGNFANYVDRLLFLPGQLYEKYGDPEGLFSTIPAVGTAMLGILAGHWLLSKNTPLKKAQGLATAGVICIALGHLWGLEFPVIKKIWTSSYVLVAGGWSLLILAAFYWAIDVKGLRRGTFFFNVIGMNPLTIYLGQRIIEFDHTAAFFAGGIAKRLPSIATIITSASEFAVRWLFLLFLFRRRIFLKL